MTARATSSHLLFVCIQNAGRSQIAAALFRSLGGEGRSAGTRPAERIHPHVVAALLERGLDVSAITPKKLTIEDAEWADRVITMGCGDECPVTGKPTEDWSLPDPKDMSRPQLDALIDEIEMRVAELAVRLRRDAATA